jgi:hypothetical protein
VTTTLTGTAYERVIQALNDHGSKGRGNAWQCVSHDDGAPSLSIGHRKDRKGVVLYCHAGCAPEDIVAALGLTMQDLFDEPLEKRERPRVVAEYPYCDENGELLLTVKRYEPGFDGERKTFRQYRANGAAGVKGVQRVLYRLPEVLAQAAARLPVIVVEGEKDVENLRAINAVATCNVGGAGKWTDEYTASLAGVSEVWIIADKDEPGRKHAAQVAESLARAGIPFRVFEAARGKDVSDHLAAGLGPQDLVPVQLEAASVPSQPGAPEAEEYEQDDEPAEDRTAEQELMDQLAELSTPDDIWELPHMAHIAQQARASMVKREGLAMLTFNRAAFLAGSSVVGSINDRGVFQLGSINALVGRSGAGSNVSKRAASVLLPMPLEFYGPHPNAFASEGDAEMYDWGATTVSPATGSALVGRMQYQAKHNVAEGEEPPKWKTLPYFVPRVELAYTEGATLLSSLKKSSSATSAGAALEPLILDAFVGDTLRADVKNQEERAAIPEGSYSLIVQAYFQAELVGEALSRTTGMAQRLRMVSIAQRSGAPELVDVGRVLACGGTLSDEDLARAEQMFPSRPASPGEMPGVVEFLTRIPCTSEPGRPRRSMVMCERMKRELRVLMEAMSAGLSQDEPLDTHVGLNLYKTAAQSALLRRSYEIDEDDWRIAKVFAEHSRKTRELALAWAKENERKEEAEDNTKVARRTRVTENTRAMTQGQVPPIVKAVAKKFRDRLRKDGDLPAMTLRDGMTAGDIDEWTASGGQEKKKGLRDAALAYGEKEGLFRKEGRRYTVKP